MFIVNIKNYIKCTTIYLKIKLKEIVTLQDLKKNILYRSI